MQDGVQFMFVKAQQEDGGETVVPVQAMMGAWGSGCDTYEHIQGNFGWKKKFPFPTPGTFRKEPRSKGTAQQTVTTNTPMVPAVQPPTSFPQTHSSLCPPQTTTILTPLARVSPYVNGLPFASSFLLNITCVRFINIASCCSSFMPEAAL